MSDTDAGDEKVPHGLLLGDTVRRRREQLGLTADQVVERMGTGVPQGFVTKLENAGWKGMISQPRLGMLARALDVSEIDLLHGAGLVGWSREIREDASDYDRELQREETLGDALAAEVVGYLEAFDADDRRQVLALCRHIAYVRELEQARESVPESAPVPVAISRRA